MLDSQDPGRSTALAEDDNDAFKMGNSCQDMSRNVTTCHDHDPAAKASAEATTSAQDQGLNPTRRRCAHLETVVI